MRFAQMSERARTPKGSALPAGHTPDIRREAAADRFAPAMGKLPGGVCVISAPGEAGRSTVIAEAVAILSNAPLTLLVSLRHASPTRAAIARSKRFCINFLEAVQIRRGAFDQSLTYSHWPDQLDWEDGPFGVPYLVGAQANLFCEVAHKATADREIVVAAVLHAVSCPTRPRNRADIENQTATEVSAVAS